MSGYKELFGFDRPGEKEARDLNALIEAAMQAKKFLKVHHWNDNAPGRGCWDLDAAGKAYAALDRALDQAAVTKLQKINPVDDLKDGGRY